MTAFQELSTREDVVCGWLTLTGTVLACTQQKSLLGDYSEWKGPSDESANPRQRLYHQARAVFGGDILERYAAAKSISATELACRMDRRGEYSNLPQDSCRADVVAFFESSFLGMRDSDIRALRVD